MSLSDDFSDSAGIKKGKFAFPIEIETPRLILREMQESDIDRIHEMTTKPGFFYYCFDGSRKAVEDFISEAKRTQIADPATGMRENHMLSVVEKDTGNMVGHVCLQRVNYVPGHNYEVNFFTDPSYQNKGYGREAIVNLMHFGFKELGLYAYTVTIHPENGPSQHVAYKEGYRKIADVSLDTVKGKQPRDLFILTKDKFYELHKLDDHPMFLDKDVPFLPEKNTSPPKGPSNG